MDYYSTLEMIRQHCLVIQSSPVPEADEVREDHLVILAGIEATLRGVALTVAPEVWVGDPKDPARCGRPMAQTIVGSAPNIEPAPLPGCDKCKRTVCACGTTFSSKR